MFGFGKKVNKVKAEVKKLENRDQLEAIVGGCLLVAAADGNISDDEAKKIDSLLRTNKNLAHFGGEITELVNRFSERLGSGYRVARAEILREIEEGIKETTGEYVVIENRRDAIRHALEIGREGDIIVLCGKGHETYQETMGVKRPFDEKVVVQELLTELRGE